MAIEPLSSAMSYTIAQPVQQAAQAATERPVTKTAAEYTEVPEQQSAAPVDNITLSVNSTEQKDPNAQDDGGQSQQQQDAQNDKLRKAVEDLNKKMSNSIAEFGFHEATNRVTIKLVDKQTKEVIKELPPEKTLDMIAKVWEMAGLLVDEKR